MVCSLKDFGEAILSDPVHRREHPEFCETSFMLGRETISGKNFITIGPMLPLAGFSLSNFLNREFFNLDPLKSSDLYLIQNWQRTITHDNSFVITINGGEYVFVQADSEDEVERVKEFLQDRSEDVEFVVANSEIDAHLRYYSYPDAKRRVLRELTL